MRFNLKTVAGMLCLAVCISKAHATLLAYEPFNYASIANGTAVAGVGESGTWACGSAPSLVTGLTYTGLPTANSAMQSSGGRQAVTFTSSLSSGTKWISFLFQSGSGNSGGNINGIYFSNGGTGLWFGFGLAPNSPTQGGLGIGSMDTTGISALGASSLASSYLGTYGSVYFVAIQIQYGAGTGGHDLVTVYLNPTANSATPVVASTYSVGTFSVGTITGVGLNVQGAGSITVDEIRIGSSYGDVSGYVGVSPSAPTGLNATPGVNQVSLSWTASTGSPTSYNVKRSTNSAGPFTAIGTTTAPTVAYTDAVLGGQTYYYVVSAVNGAGESANSSPAVSASPTLGVPAAPTGLAAIPGSAQVALSWNSSAFAASYNVKRSTTSGAETFLTNVTATSFIDVAVVNGTTYYYKVSATNAAGQSANSSEVNAAPFGIPAAPTGLVATPNTNRVFLSWTASTGSPASYNVKRSTNSGGPFTTIGTTTAPTVAYTNSILGGKTYYYVVSAVNGSGESANSSPSVSATPIYWVGPWTAAAFASKGVRGFNNPGDTSDQSMSDLAASGANVLRLSVNLSPNTGNITNATGYTYSLSPFTNVVASAAKYGFRVVMVLDGFTSSLFTGTNSASLQASVSNIWITLAAQFKTNNSVAAYDLLNEPVVNGGTDYWYPLATNLVRGIRAVDPDKAIIFEPQPWALSSGFASLVPLPFTNIVYSFHTYSPYEIAYQGIPGNGYYTQETYPSPATADIGAVNISNLASAGNGTVYLMNLAPVVAFQQNYNVPIYVGEFSCVRWAPVSATNGLPTPYNYVADAITLFESHGWSWNYHAWRNYWGWDAEVPESLFYQWPYVNGYPNIPSGLPYSWPQNDYSSYRTNTTDTMLLLRQYFKTNLPPQ